MKTLLSAFILWLIAVIMLSACDGKADEFDIYEPVEDELGIYEPIEGNSSALTPIGMAYFFRQIEVGEGNYTEEKEGLTKHYTTALIMDELKKMRNN